MALINSPLHRKYPQGYKPPGLLVPNPDAPALADRYLYMIDGSHQLHNMARPHEEVAFKTGTNDLIKRGDATGVCADFVNTASADTTSESCYQLPTMGVMVEGWLLARWRLDDLDAGGQYFFGHADTAGSARIYIYSVSSTSVGVRLGGNSATTFSAGLVAGKWYNMAIAWGDGSSVAPVYLNGVRLGTTLNSTGDPGSTMANATHIGQLRRSGLNTGGVDGQVAMVAMGTTRATDAQLKALTLDPYSLVMPAQPGIFYTSDGVAPTGRIMSSQAHGGGLAGLGGIAGPGGGLAG